MRFTIRTALITGAASLVGAAGATAALVLAAPPALTEQNFKQLQQYIRPAPAEARWQEIPWRASFWEAVTEAQKQDKPILLWAMNGHPLACT
jgi:hypothetical protein